VRHNEASAGLCCLVLFGTEHKRLYALPVFLGTPFFQRAAENVCSAIGKVCGERLGMYHLKKI
jgi:hypothetical protein